LLLIVFSRRCCLVIVVILLYFRRLSLSSRPHRVFFSSSHRSSSAAAAPLTLRPPNHWGGKTIKLLHHLTCLHTSKESGLAHMHIRAKHITKNLPSSSPSSANRRCPCNSRSSLMRLNNRRKRTIAV
jgi:hypothetical protein